MIGLQYYRYTPTTFSLNGPVLSFTTQPSSKLVCNSGIATFIGIATATFPSQTPPNPAVGLGSISYRWYEVGVGALSDGSNISGSATTTLVLSNLSSPSDNNRQFYLNADYISSGTTPNAINDNLQTNVVSLTVYPSISITTQPTPVTTITNNPATINIVASTTDPSVGFLSYQWKLNGNNVSDGTITEVVQSVTKTTTVSGTTTPTLTISSNTVGVQTVSCTVSHTLACNSPISSNEVEVNIVSADSINRSILKYEIVRDDNTTLYSSGEQNIFDSSLNFTSDTNNPSRNIVVYSPEKDINVKITLAGSSGKTVGNNLGGEGGLSSFEYTLRRNTEYLFKLNPQSAPFGGVGGGGGGAFFYEKGKLLAVCGGGGGASSGGRGGAGGGIGVAGQSGVGRNAGSGGTLIAAGTLSQSGLSVSGIIGGRVESCTVGDYYKSQGISPCSDVGSQQWRNSSGTVVSGTSTITRGFKAGPSFRNNGGNSSSQENGEFVGGGGSGAVGGNATQSSGSSGGGASGYTNGNINILSTQLGGNALQNSYVIIELQP